MTQQKESKRTTRERAAEARAAAEAQQRRRENRIRLIVGIVVAALVVGIVAVGVIGSRKADTSANPDAALPTGVTKPTYGVPYGTGTDAVPQLQLWEDFQCPACKQLEQTNGSGIEQMATSGAIRLLWRPTTFIDAKVGNDSSARAAAAWGCAIDQGKTSQYHNTVFANQPQEGVGFTDAQLLDFGKQAGLSGSAYDSFAECVGKKTYGSWVSNSTQAFYDETVPGTPTGYLVFKDKKTELTAAQMADPAQLQAAVDAIQK